MMTEQGSVVHCRTNTLPVFLKSSALMFLYKECKFLLVLCPSRCPGLSVSVKVNMCFPRFTLLSCHTAVPVL